MHSYDGRCAQLRRSVCTVGDSTDGHGRAALAACPGLRGAAEPGVPSICGRPVVRAVPRDEGGRDGRALMADVTSDGASGPGHSCGGCRRCAGGRAGFAVPRAGRPAVAGAPMYGVRTAVLDPRLHGCPVLQSGFVIKCRIRLRLPGQLWGGSIARRRWDRASRNELRLASVRASASRTVSASRASASWSALACSLVHSS